MTKTTISVYRTFLSSTAIDLQLQLAKINLAVLDPRAALRHARQAVDRSQDPECCYAWGAVNGLHLAGLCHRQLGEPGLVKKRLAAALKVRTKIQHPEVEETRRALAALETRP